ncbi:hypothetical protein [Gordonia rubripertincta]|uniref:6-pyruvoyl tetrahydrobiopterin synthase n=1 Tax=Gordonia rubripertincta TaxID=36822 RepID=A0ABT4MZS2_GORRU|nr:hypothetical protein [Gordonia rubripertincta]MCZ4551212.1 hypothetical protein [Gordonia rubripertincta]
MTWVRGIVAGLALVALVAPASPVSAAPVGPDVGPAGTSLIHGDLASTDSTPHPGPGPAGKLTASSFPAGACAATFIGSDSLPVALCTGYVGADPVNVAVPTVQLFDPATAQPIASLQLTKGGLLGGVYGYLDNRDRVVVADGSGSIQKVAHRKNVDNRWQLFVDERIDVRAHIPAGDAITGLAPDYQGRIWFATTNGVIGTVDPAGVIGSTHLPAGEKLTNGLSVRPGGVSILTSRALYEMTADVDGTPTTVWRQNYDTGDSRRPGQLAPGSGTTPTYFGPGGDEWVAIVDNADRPNLIVYRSDDGSQVCSTPAFGTSGQGTENSPMAWGNSIVIPSTYGFGYPPFATSGPSDPPAAAFTGGMTRIDVSETGCRRIWESQDRVATLPELSRADGLIYALAYGPLPPGGGIQQAGPVYFTAIDFETGGRKAFTQVGIAPLDEPLQLTGTIGASGALWQATVGRMLKITP